MPSDRLGYNYNDSDELIKEGDLIVLDGHPGRVRGVFLPETRSAEDYNCEDTGGILVLYDDGVLALHPIGYSHQIRKRGESVRP